MLHGITLIGWFSKVIFFEVLPYVTVFVKTDHSAQIQICTEWSVFVKYCTPAYVVYI